MFFAKKKKTRNFKRWGSDFKHNLFNLFRIQFKYRSLSSVFCLFAHITSVQFSMAKTCANKPTPTWKQTWVSMGKKFVSPNSDLKLFFSDYEERSWDFWTKKTQQTKQTTMYTFVFSSQLNLKHLWIILSGMLIEEKKKENTFSDYTYLPHSL